MRFGVGNGEIHFDKTVQGTQFFFVATDDKSYGSAELDRILRDRSESLKRIKADLRKVEELQRRFQEEQKGSSPSVKDHAPGAEGA